MALARNGLSTNSPGARYWPTPAPVPLLDDGTVDVRALCRLWDEAFNEGAGLPILHARKERPYG